MEVGQGPNWGCSAKGKKKSKIFAVECLFLETTTVKQINSAAVMFMHVCRVTWEEMAKFRAFVVAERLSASNEDSAH
jgi:hypothetical protein